MDTTLDETQSIPPPAERRQLQSSFDRLVESNLELTKAVGRMVRAGYVLMALQAVAVLVALYR